jgi:GntR family transcriptional regulator, rspAB operon transcriptional repressor
MAGSSNLRSMVLESLRADILNRRIPSGHVLLEKEVAARLSVSKTPVREALAVLCQEDLVQLFPRRGYLVRELGLQEVIDTFDLRVILEGAAAERAATQLSNAEFDILQGLCEHDCCSPAGASRQTEHIEHSLDFHLLIARCSRNQLLAADIERLLRTSRRITAIGFTYGEHAGIVEALRSRDPSASRKAMEDHIIAGRRLALQMLERGADHRSGEN